MDYGIDIIGFLMATAFAAGCIDAIAGGGGLLTIPALLAAGIPPVAAIATNKLQSSFGTGGAVLAFWRKGHLDLRRFAGPVLASLIGSALGAWALTLIDPTFLKALIPALLILIMLYFLFGPRMSDDDRHSRAGPLALLAIVFVIGAYDGFFGPGTGSFFTTALVALFGLGMVRAIAHTRLLNFASNIAALVVMIVGGHVIWMIGLSMAVCSIAGGQVGAHVAMRFGAKAVRPLLVVICLGLTAKLLADPANPLTAAVLAYLG